MKGRYFFLLIVIILIVAVLSNANDHTISVTKNLASMPIAFTENQGQWDDEVLYRANAGGATMWFTLNGVFYQFTRRIIDENSIDSDENFDPIYYNFDREPNNIETMMIKAIFVGINSSPVLRSEELMEYKCNYFIGNDPEKWKSDVSNYQAIVYENIYNGIDLKYYGNGRQMEYDFICDPGVDISQIRIQYEGVESISVNALGELVVETKWNSVTEEHPVVYQMEGSTRKEISGLYQLFENNTFSFELGNDYDPTKAVIIDPVLEYSSYLGGVSEGENSTDIEIDDNGNVYITGYAFSSDFPTLNPYQEEWAGSWDVFLTKIDSTGENLIFSTYFGGSVSETSKGIKLDMNGSIYLTGHTNSPDFPTINAYQSIYDSCDAFIAKFSNSGNELIYSTYLGGSNYEACASIDIDSAGCAYVTGFTKSIDFPTVNPIQEYQDGQEVFITKMNANGDDIIYSTFLGGSGSELGQEIVVDSEGNVYIVGLTNSTDYPVQNPFQIQNSGLYDVFLTKLNSIGSSILYSTYLGGESNDHCSNIVLGDPGEIYLAGGTISAEFPVVNAYQDNHAGDADIFITKLNYLENEIEFSTFFGGSSSESVHGLSIDSTGVIYLGGNTNSLDFPLFEPFQNSFQGLNHDCYFTYFNSDITEIIFSTYLGGSSDDVIASLVGNNSGAVYFVGSSISEDFPVRNAFQDELNGFHDITIGKFTPLHCCNHDGIRGDANIDGSILVDDLIDLVDYLFKGNYAPNCKEEGDANGTGQILVDDLILLVNYIFKSGPPPVACP